MTELSDRPAGRARPTSQSLTRSPTSTSTLGDLTSRCSTGGACACKYARPRATPAQTRYRRASGQIASARGSRSASQRLPAATYSVTSAQRGAPGSIDAPMNRHTFGCRSRASIAASARNASSMSRTLGLARPSAATPAARSYELSSVAAAQSGRLGSRAAGTAVHVTTPGAGGGSSPALERRTSRLAEHAGSSTKRASAPGPSARNAASISRTRASFKA
mmetsp:Transcript_4607/g.14411  ORF Transcript_4607/g.14411 Transcript_4607/m.14411 type:complete len:220 (+) Transcript_4607:185-844(+)